MNASTLIGNDSIANESMGMRFRTSVSTATSQVNTSYGFVSMGIRYSQVNNQPIVSNVSLNGQNDIALDGIYGQQTKVFATADVYDEDGCNTISASGVMYRSGISEGYGCEGNSTNCIHAVYNSSPGCEILNCSGVGDKTATISCEFSLEN